AYTGGRALPLLDSMYDSARIRTHQGPHEQDMGHSAQAYFKVTRKPGALIVTSGPGATNLATSIKDAGSDGDGLILIVGQIPNKAIDIGEEAFQGAKIVEPYSHWAKWTYRIRNAGEIQSVVKTAYLMAQSGRPGSVVIEFPSPVQLQTDTLRHLDEVPVFEKNIELPILYGDELKKAGLDYAVEQLAGAKRPVIYAGGGVYNAGAVRELLELAEKIDAPFATTLMLLGALPSSHRLNLGMPGMHGHPDAILAMHNADKLLVVGARLDDRIVGDPELFAPYAEILWVEPNYPGISEEIAGRVTKIEADARHALQHLSSNVPGAEHGQWLSQIYDWREEYPMPTRAPRQVIEHLNRAVRKYEDREPYVTTGVGGHQMFLAEFWDFDPEIGKRMLLTSGGLGTMGTGTPFGIGALIADPDRPVYVFNGDGSFIMDQRSLLTAYQMKQDGLIGEDNGLKEIVFRDNSLGMVGFWQNRFYRERKAYSELRMPQEYFKHIALANEFAYFTANFIDGNPEQNAQILDSFAAYRGNALLEVRLLPTEVLPMVPSGKSAKDIILPYGMNLDENDLLVGKSL
ncbi:thiamine pyrophosphate-binding protein, partial [Candidatus Woesearchaeota archaeon]|nr:thiamine pyrophosphate-binding protein [Candidatus Woesearchaeota archaeon]